MTSKSKWNHVKSDLIFNKSVIISQFTFNNTKVHLEYKLKVEKRKKSAMKKLFLSILALSIVLITTANNNETKKETKAELKSEMASTINLNGSVSDLNSAETLVGVEVQIEGTKLKTYTDFDGNFSFENVKPGNYKIVASYISYERNIVKNIEAKANIRNNITIKMASSN